VYIPLKALRARIGDHVSRRDASGAFVREVVEVSQICVAEDHASQVEAVADSIRKLLEKSHKTADYSITVSE
jgi:hypothetical protein